MSLVDVMYAKMILCMVCYSKHLYGYIVSTNPPKKVATNK